MSEFIRPFDVESKVTDHVYHCRFSHCWNAISTRHADAIDCMLLVDGKAAIVGLARPAFEAFRSTAERDLSDREASYVAAEYLRERLEQEDEHALYDVSQRDVLRVIEKLGIR